MTIQDAASSDGDSPFVNIRSLVKVYKGPAGDFTALKGLDVQVERGEFVAVIGKSGSGKSTFINMLAGIDRPTSGEVWIGGTPIHRLNETQMAEWRGHNLGIVFQFFQLIPTLTLAENVMLPMELNGLYGNRRQRKDRAQHLLEMVEMEHQANKLPSAVSGGQQQRVAIARALANDPPLIIADEPTGNLDSKTAEKVFALFEELVGQGKTILLVTHDDDQARRVNRTIVISDGEIVNEYLVEALSALSQDQLVEVTRRVESLEYAPGHSVIRQGEMGDKFYIIVDGEAEVYIDQPGGTQMLVNRLHQGQYFGEMALVGNGLRTATVRAAQESQLSVAALDADAFNYLVSDSRTLREELTQIMERRLIEYRVQALAALPFDELSSLTKDLVAQSYAPGTTILRQGTLGDSFFVIVDGEVEVILEQPGRDPKVLARLGSGQYFGEMALLGSRRRVATVRAASGGPVRLVELKQGDFWQLMARSGQFKSRMEVSATDREEEIRVISAGSGEDDDA